MPDFPDQAAGPESGSDTPRGWQTGAVENYTPGDFEDSPGQSYLEETGYLPPPVQTHPPMGSPPAPTPVREYAVPYVAAPPRRGDPSGPVTALSLLSLSLIIAGSAMLRFAHSPYFAVATLLGVLAGVITLMVGWRHVWARSRTLFLSFPLAILTVMMLFLQPGLAQGMLQELTEPQGTPQEVALPQPSFSFPGDAPSIPVIPEVGTVEKTQNGALSAEQVAAAPAEIEETVKAFAGALLTGDCEAYMSTTTQAAREADGVTTCAQLKEQTEGLDELSYTAVVQLPVATGEVTTEGPVGTCVLVLTLTDPKSGQSLKGSIEIYLLHQKGSWLVHATKELQAPQPVL